MTAARDDTGRTSMDRVTRATAESTPAPVTMHPEATDDATTVRWVVPLGTLPVVGRIVAAPGEFGRRLARGEVAVEVLPGAVVVSLAAPLSWRGDGAAIRTQLAVALRDPRGWGVGESPGPGGLDPSAALDAELRRLTLRAIAGMPGEYVRSHGGCVDLVDVRGGCVVLRLSGACGGCPAAAFTLQRRFEDELRRLCPGVIQVSLAHT